MRIKALGVLVLVGVITAGCSGESKEAVRSTTSRSPSSTTTPVANLGSMLHVGPIEAQHRYRYPVGFQRALTVSFESPVGGDLLASNRDFFPSVLFPEFGESRGLTFWDLSRLTRPAEVADANGLPQPAAPGGYLNWLRSLDQLTVKPDGATTFGGLKGEAVRVVGAAHITTPPTPNYECGATTGVVIAISQDGWECITSGEHAWVAVIDNRVVVTLTWKQSAKADSAAAQIIASLEYAG